MATLSLLLIIQQKKMKNYSYFLTLHTTSKIYTTILSIKIINMCLSTLGFEDVLENSNTWEFK